MYKLKLLSMAAKDRVFKDYHTQFDPHYTIWSKIEDTGAINPVASILQLPLKSDEQRRPWTI